MNVRRRSANSREFRRHALRPVAAVVAMTVIAAILSGSLWLIRIRHDYPPDAPVSYATVQKIHYLGNFPIYGGAVVICMLTGVIFLHRRRAVLSPLHFLARVPARARSFTWHRAANPEKLLLTLALALVATVGFTSQSFYSISGSLDRMREPLAALLTDTFHEGELLAPIPSLHSGAAAPTPFLAHGPGMDLIPGLIAVHFFEPGHRIAGTRIGAALLTLMAFGSFMFAAYQVFSFIRPGRTTVDRFLLFAALICVLIPYEYLCRGSPRRLVLFLQVGLVFQLAGGRRVSAAWRFVLAGLLGASLPLGFLYNYSLGVSSVAFAAVGGVLIWQRQPSLIRRRDLLAASIGACVAALGSAVLLGPKWMATIAANVSYWSRFGQILTFTPMFRREWISRPEWYCYALLWMVVPALAGAWIILDYLDCRAWSITLQRRTAEILLLTMCVLESRTFLERADFQHFGFAAPTFVLAFSGLFVVMVGSPAALMLRKWHARTRIYASAALFILLAIAEYPNLRLNSVTRKWREIESSRQLPDAQILRADYAAAVEEMQAKISQQSCFYTLTSEGTWYYLFDRPSCSTFAQLNYARTTQGQQQVIADLRRFRPRIILLNGDLRDGSYDYIPLQEHSANVWNYVLATYQPLRTIGGFHFYELRE